MKFPGLRFSVVPAVVCSLFAVSVTAGEPQDAIRAASAYVHTTGSGDDYFALSLRGPDGDVLQARDHVVLFDTSASQVGEHRRFALDVLESFLAGLSPEDRVRLFAVDSSARALDESWNAAGSEQLQAAVRQLKKQVPLGATKLASAIEESVAAAASDRPRSVVYIGDGMSTGDLVAPEQLLKLAASLREQQVAVNSFAVGPNTDLQLLGAFAQHTGGALLFDQPDRDDNAAAEEFGAELAQAARRPVFYLSSLQLDPAPRKLIPAVLPLRSDRATLLLGQGEIPVGAEVTAVTATDDTWQWSVENVSGEGENAVLELMWRQAAHDQGASVALAGEGVFRKFREHFVTQIGRMVQAGQTALASGELEQASQVLRQVQALDAGNVEVETLTSAVEDAQVRLVNQQEDAGDAANDQDAPANADDTEAPAEPTPAGDAAPPEPAGLIPSYEELQAIKTQRLQLDVTQAIQAARNVADEEPDAALDLLRRTLNGVISATDVDPTVRGELRLRLERAVLDVQNLRDVREQEEIRFVERQTQLEARARLTEQLLVEEERLEQLIDRVRGLINEGRHGDDNAFLEAREVAQVAVNLRPGEGTATAAYFGAEAITQLNRSYRMRAQRAERFLETLHQVELSHVPFPDEPPIRFPPAAVWRALTERRSKWASVDLRRETPLEEAIRAQFDQPTSVDFIDTPLRDALDFIEDLHDINIWIDESALSDEGVAVDEPVTLSLEGIRLRSALRLMLEPLGLTYVIDDEVLKITTQTMAEEILTVRVYPVADLVIPIVTPMAAGIGGGMGGMGGIGMGGMGGMGMGGMGGMGMGGMGGMGMGGMGGGMFSIPPEQIPDHDAADPANANGADLPLKKKNG